MRGEELFKIHISKRDFSNSDNDIYAQLLETLENYIQDDIYNILEEAEKKGKRIGIKEHNESLLVDSYSIQDIEFV